MPERDYWTVTMLWSNGTLSVSAARRRDRETCLRHVEMLRQLGYTVNSMIHVRPKAERAPHA